MRCIRLAFAICALLSTSCHGEPDADSLDVLVRVGGVAMDSRSGSPVMLLEEHEGDRSLPIWIGLAEARSIAIEIDHVKPPRPNTHDMAKRLLDELDGRLERVVVTELRGGTYFAVLLIRSRGQLLEVDVRPSDGIALALRAGSPVFVRAPLFEEGGAPVEADEPPTEREASGPDAPHARSIGIPSATCSAPVPNGSGNGSTSHGAIAWSR